MKYRISYTYNNPHGAGPFRGRTVIDRAEKPKKGDSYYAMFGAATIKTVSVAKAQS